MTFFKNRSVNISIFIIIVVSVITFGNIKDIFFQQDEWLGLGGAISRSESGGLIRLFADMIPSNSQTVRLVPLTSIVNYLVFNLLGLKFGLYGVMSLAIGLINAVWVNIVVQKITRSYLVSTLVAILWLTNSLSDQAITWVSTVVPSQLSFLFFLISFYIFIKFVEEFKSTLLYLSLFFVTVSLSFKETGIFYIVIFPLYFLFFSKIKRSKQALIKKMPILLIPIILIFLIPRVFYHPQNALLKTTMYSPTVDNVIYNTFLLPARSLSQVFIGQTKLYQLFNDANKIHYSESTNGFVVESIIADVVSLLTSFYFLLFVLLAAAIAKREFKGQIIWSLLCFFISTLPFIFFQNQAAILERRYYVYPALFASILMVVVFYSLFSKLNHKLKLGIMTLLFTPLVIYNISRVHTSLQSDILVGQYRHGILQSISAIRPKLSQTNIFYFYSDNTGFYEFQSGFGQTLAVWLYDSGKIPTGVLTDVDFWDSSYEGIKSYNGQKFGYFMSYNKLLEALKNDESIPLTSVHSFYWDQQKHTVKDISGDIRLKLQLPQENL